jgi:hypothetical protein
MTGVYTRRPTTSGSAKIAPSRLWVGRSAASAGIAPMASAKAAKAESMILRDMAGPRLIRESYPLSR